MLISNTKRVLECRTCGIGFWGAVPMECSAHDLVEIVVFDGCLCCHEALTENELAQEPQAKGTDRLVTWGRYCDSCMAAKEAFARAHQNTGLGIGLSALPRHQVGRMMRSWLRAWLARTPDEVLGEFASVIESGDLTQIGRLAPLLVSALNRN